MGCDEGKCCRASNWPGWPRRWPAMPSADDGAGAGDAGAGDDDDDDVAVAAMTAVAPIAVSGVRLAVLQSGAACAPMPRPTQRKQPLSTSLPFSSINPMAGLVVPLAVQRRLVLPSRQPAAPPVMSDAASSDHCTNCCAAAKFRAGLWFASSIRTMVTACPASTDAPSD